MQFRDALATDVPAVVALVESAYRGEASRVGWTTEADLLDGQRTDAQAVHDIVASASSRLRVAVEGEGEGALVGCCHLERRAPSTCYFGMFAVSPRRQGAGVGDALLADAEHVAREEFGAQVIEMTVIVQRQDLIAWYLRRGYVETGERRPFPHGDERFGIPRRPDLEFTVLAKPLRADA